MPGSVLSDPNSRTVSIPARFLANTGVVFDRLDRRWKSPNRSFDDPPVVPREHTLTEPFMAASHNDVLHLLIQVGILLAVARGLGEICQRLNQPSVVGEILAGVLLGPSVLGALAPVLARWTIPQTPIQGYLLEVVGLIGVMLLLVITGFETDLALVRRKAKTAMGIAVGRAAGPIRQRTRPWLLVSLATSSSTPDRRTVFALFLATAMSISAIPVLAKILLDMRMMRRDIGQTMLAAGMIDDITGWTMLGIVATLASVGRIATEETCCVSLLTVAVFVVASITVGRLIVVAKPCLRPGSNEGPGPAR